jgi:adenosylcobinamide kinase/adenosylcobinamide-phosphate guanylyltransferase
VEVYIGGYAQGKLDYVLQKHPEIAAGADAKDAADAVLDGAVCAPDCRPEGHRILDHYHLLVRRQMEEGIDPREWMERLLTACPDMILISDEIGNGIVPAEPFERKWREMTGRLLCTAAQKADRVERIFCGMGQRIK